MGAAGTRHAHRSAHTGLSRRSPGPWRGSPCPCGWWLMSHHCIWGQDPEQTTEQGGRAENKPAGGSGTRNPQPVWESLTGPLKGARQHVYFGEGLLVGLLTENCLEAADEILPSVCLYRSMSSVKTGAPWGPFRYHQHSAYGGTPPVGNRGFGVKGKCAVKAINRKGVGSAGHGLFLGGKAVGLVPWQWDGGTPPTR